MTTAKERITGDETPVELLVRPVADGDEPDHDDDHSDHDDDPEKGAT